jgi:hypothetical protein
MPTSIHGDIGDADALEQAAALDLLQALYLTVTSSKGISSVVMCRILGTTQSTAWRLGHSIREMMNDRDGKGPQLRNIVEIDIKYLGGAPRRRQDGMPNPRGKGTSKAKILVAVERDGAAKGTVIPSESAHDIEAATAGTIEPASWIMSDSQSSFRGAFARIAGMHETVNHSAGEYARDGVYASTATASGLSWSGRSSASGTGSANSTSSATSTRWLSAGRTGSARGCNRRGGSPEGSSCWSPSRSSSPSSSRQGSDGV